MHTCSFSFSTHASQNSLPREWDYSLAHSMVPLIGTQWLDLHTSANTIKMVSHRHAEDQHDLDNPSRRLFLGNSRFCEVVTNITWVIIDGDLFHLCAHVCLCECMPCVCGCHQRPEEGISSLGARVPCGCEAPNMGAGN